MSNENTIECIERLQEENDELRALVKGHEQRIQRVRDWARECVSLDEDAVLECFFAIDVRQKRGGPHRLCFCEGGGSR